MGFKPEYRPCSVKCGASHKFSDIDVQKLTTNLALQLYAVLLIIPDLRYGFLNSEVLYHSHKNGFGIGAESFSQSKFNSEN